MKRNGQEYFFEIETVKPNIDVFEKSKTKFLEWVARKRMPINVYLAFQYNPYSEELAKHQRQIQRLQEELQRQNDARREERMVWILVALILLDAYFFTSMENIIGPLVIMAFQLIVMDMVTRKMGMEQVEQLIDRMIAVIVKGVSGND